MNNLSEIEETYSKRNRQSMLLLIGIMGLLGMATLVATPLGSASLGIADVVEVFLSKIPFLDTEADKYDTAIVWENRLPRIIMAIVAGFGFALSGTAMQGVLRNPLASPFTLGISSAACFGGALAMLLGADMVDNGKFIVMASAFLFGIGALLLIYGISRRRGASPETVILCGIALMYMFMAMTSAISMGGMLSFLLMGSLLDSDWEDVLVVFIPIMVILPLLMRRSWDMNALALGDDVAQGVGVDLKRVRLTAIVYATVIVSIIVSFTGLIGFVCLVSPYIARRLMGNDHRFIFPCAGFLGALMLLSTDTLARTMVESVEIPVALLTTIIGVPFLIYLALSRKEWA